MSLSYIMKVIKHVVVFFVGLYIVLASNMFFVHTLISSGDSLFQPVKEANAQSIVLPTITPTPTSVPTNTPTPTLLVVGDPVTIEIPKFSINTHIVPVGIAEDNTMQTPGDFSQVGWYNKGIRPGEEGAAIINGHYDDTQGKPAVFYNLSDLNTGDEIVVKTALGKILKFQVESSYSEEYTSFPKELVYSKYEGKGIRLITCDGVWITKEKTYSRRLVVNARLVKD